MSKTAARPYHHGDLHRALIDAALDAIADEEAANIRLRDVARRAGVSHAAPAHHFIDKAGMVTAIASEGFALLAAELAATYDRTRSLLEVAVAYVHFAIEHQAHFEVMFRTELYRTDDQALVEAKARSAAALYGHVGDVAANGASGDRLSAGVAAWSLVHGLATLWLNGDLPQELGHDPEAVARSVASYLLRPAPQPQPGRSRRTPTR
ncbi:MAG TPA: WHG domain-containing protein [Acidimicrobiales bacterium]|nr:WHG domain-containing protein [Acidimicrobiales bacterium]